MQKTKWNILSTRPLADEVLHKAALRSISIECISFIETEPIRNKELENKILQLQEQNITAVFTSMNAVEAVAHYLSKEPVWAIYCIGHTTKELVSNTFGNDSIRDTANSASLLADQIIQHDKKGIYFFCGDQRRDELPGKLKSNDIKVNEITVYQTKKQPTKLEKAYDGVLFFSPTAVESFFSMNILEKNTTLFAIGSTTSDAIKLFSSNTTVISEQPGKEALVEKAITYFSTIQKQAY